MPWGVLLGLAAMQVTGCGPRVSRFQVTDYRANGQVSHLHESFDECYYAIRPDGNTDVVLYRREPVSDDALEFITQIVHIRTVWRSFPGRTIAHESQINGRITYAIMGPEGGTTFEGTGSVFFEENRRGDELTGTVELSLLRPVRTIKGGQRVFDRAEVSGEFCAERNRRRVVRLVNEATRAFGFDRPSNHPRDRWYHDGEEIQSP